MKHKNRSNKTSSIDEKHDHNWYFNEISNNYEFSEREKDLRLALLNGLGRDCYFSWLEAAKFRLPHPNSVFIYFVGKFRKQTVKERYGARIIEIINSITPNSNVGWLTTDTGRSPTFIRETVITKDETDLTQEETQALNEAQDEKYQAAIPREEVQKHGQDHFRKIKDILEDISKKNREKNKLRDNEDKESLINIPQR